MKCLGGHSRVYLLLPRGGGNKGNNDRGTLKAIKRECDVASHGYENCKGMSNECDLDQGGESCHFFSGEERGVTKA